MLAVPSVPVSRTERVGRLVTGSCCLAAGLGIIALGGSMFIRRGGWEPVYLIGTIAAALVAVLFGLAATFYRWTDQCRPSSRIVRVVFLPVFLPLALISAVWNA